MDSCIKDTGMGDCDCIDLSFGRVLSVRHQGKYAWIDEDTYLLCSDGIRIRGCEMMDIGSFNSPKVERDTSIDGRCHASNHHMQKGPIQNLLKAQDGSAAHRNSQLS